MAEITQKLGFDVTQGVSALNNLTTATQGLTKSLQALNKVSLSNVSKRLSGLNRVLGNTPKKAQAAATALGTLGASAGIPQAQQSLSGLNNALGVTQEKAKETGGALRASFAAAFISNKALSGLGQIRDLLLDAATASREFGRAVAEVSTVARGSTFAGLSNTIRELSKQFGSSEVEQAEAAYQAFSNQTIQSERELSAFGVTANTLATGSVASVADSVNILSSVLNSYGAEAGTATQISDVLFKTVEAGRLRISEIANTLGTVTPLAKEAGVSFQEITAALATITRRGTTASVAMTQVRGIVSKLLKPTELMNKAFRSFGQSDGPSAIKAAGGLSNLLLKMRQFADDNGTSLSKMFGRVRAGAGALNLTAEGGKDFNQILKDLEGSAGAAQEAFDKINGSDAKQAEIAFNKLKVTLSTLGDAIVPVITEFAKFANKAVPDAQVLGVAIAGITAALVVLAGAAAGALIALLPVGALASILIPITPIIVAIGLATAALVLLIEAQNVKIRETIALRTEDAKAAAENSQKTLEEETKKLDAIKKSAQETDQLIRDVYQSQFAVAAESNAKAVASFQGVISVFVDSRKKVLSEIQAAIKGADTEIVNSGKRLIDIQKQIADIKFDKSTENLKGQAKVAAELSRAFKTGAKSRRDLANAGLDQDKTRTALEGRAETFRQLADAAATAATTKTKFDDKQVATAKLNFLKLIAKDEKKRVKDVTKLEKDLAGKAKEVTAEINQSNSEMENLATSTIAAVGVMGDLSSTAKEVADASEIIAKNIGAFEKIANTNPTQGLDEKVGAGGEIEKAGKQAVQGLAQFFFDTTQTQKTLQDAVGQQVFDISANVKAIAVNAEVQLTETAAKDAVAQANLALANKAVDLEVKASFTVGPDATVFSNFAQDFASQWGSVTGEIGGGEAAMRRFIDATLTGIEDFDAAQTEGAAATIERAQQALNAIKTKDDSTQTPEQISKVQAAIDEAKVVLDAKKAVTDAEVVLSKAAANTAKIELQGAGRAAATAGTAAEKSATAVSTIGPAGTTAGNLVAQGANKATQALKIQEKQAKKTAEASVPGAGGGAFFGKAIHRQAGGFTRGQDRILTSTAPGEFVMNAASSRQFRSELTAMNAGQQPQFRENGGATTNVGDINVNISTPDASDIQGRTIARDLKRELRTRTSSL